MRSLSSKDARDATGFALGVLALNRDVGHHRSVPQRRKPAPRVISVVVESRRHAPDGPLFGAEALVALEQLIRDAYAFAGIDADAPMRRDIAVVLRRPIKSTKRKQRKR